MNKKTEIPDWRHIDNGWEIPTETYSDQPYIVKTADGAWLCSVTTGVGHEGASGQHILCMRSTDQGKTWTDRVALEPSDGPEASYSVLLAVPTGRVYCFYNHNTDNLRAIKADNPPYEDGLCRRVDSQGYYVFKFSDDCGKTWSADRYPIPVREMEIDRKNAYGGEIQFFWNVGRPFIHDGAAYCSLHKVGGFGEGFFTSSEGVLLRSENILSESDPTRIEWETLPEGEAGLRTPLGGGPVAEEHSYCVLSDGSLHSVYRTVDGHPAWAISRDGGRTWTDPVYLSYADGGVVKHPRAANFVWSCGGGRYLYWFHNHGGRVLRERAAAEGAGYPYQHRNPVFVLGGLERDSPEGKVISWTQPEILLYDDDPLIRMSYPDLVEDEGQFFVSETQKDLARVHAIPPEFLEKLWDQFEIREVAPVAVLETRAEPCGSLSGEAAMPTLPEFAYRDNGRADHGSGHSRGGFTLEIQIEFEDLAPGQRVLDTRTPDGRGLVLRTSFGGTLEIEMYDGQTRVAWDSDPGAVAPGRNCHVAVVVDGGPRIISFVVDGRFCDGGDHRQFGWGRFSPGFLDAKGSESIRLAPDLRGSLRLLRIYNRALLTTEIIGNYRQIGE